MSIPNHLKYERRKADFVKLCKDELKGINIKKNILDVLIILCNLAEDYFYSRRGTKYGKLKKESILNLLKDLLHDDRKTESDYNEENISNMIETIINNKLIKKVRIYHKVYRYIKKKFTVN
jgi:hypothetical protein